MNTEQKPINKSCRQTTEQVPKVMDRERGVLLNKTVVLYR